MLRPLSFVCSRQSHTISRSHLDGSGQRVVVNQAGNPEGLAVDSVARNLHWVDARGKRIEVARLDGSFRKVGSYFVIGMPDWAQEVLPLGGTGVVFFFFAIFSVSCLCLLQTKMFV